MTQPVEMAETVRGIIEARGKYALDIARAEILNLNNGGEVSSALKHFAKVTLRSAIPVFPALMSLSCEAAGGKPETTHSIAGAMMLITEAADIHDDIIDKSMVKYSKKTVFGKFGGDVALLAGDVLLVQGSSLVRKECQLLGQEQKELIPRLVSEALMRISKAEARETHLKRKLEVAPDEFLKVIKLRAVVPEVHCRIGGILADAAPHMIEFLAQYGRIFGLVSTVGGEFLDLMEYQELQNRLTNECPTLPLLCALQNVKIKAKLKLILRDKNLTRSKAGNIAKTVMSSEEVGALKRDMLSIINKEISRVSTKLRNSEGKELTLLLQAGASLLQN